MSEDWLPIVVGIAIIAFALAIVRLAPHSSWGMELRRSYGIRATGSRGNRTRRDHMRSAAVATVLAVVLDATSYAVAVLGDNAAEGSQRGAIAMTYTYAALMLAAMAAVAALRSVWKAIVWRIELPDTPAHRRGLADAIDHLLDGSLSSQERADFLDVRYLHPQLEQVRRATIKLATQHSAAVPDGYRAQIKAWTAGIRASAGPSPRSQAPSV